MADTQSRIKAIMDDAIQGRNASSKETYQPSLLKDLEKLWQRFAKS